MGKHTVFVDYLRSALLHILWTGWVVSSGLFLLRALLPWVGISVPEILRLITELLLIPIPGKLPDLDLSLIGLDLHALLGIGIYFVITLFAHQAIHAFLQTKRTLMLNGLVGLLFMFIVSLLLLRLGGQMLQIGSMGNALVAFALNTTSWIDSWRTTVIILSLITIVYLSAKLVFWRYLPEVREEPLSIELNAGQRASKLASLSLGRMLRTILVSTRNAKHLLASQIRKFQAYKIKAEHKLESVAPAKPNIWVEA